MENWAASVVFDVGHAEHTARVARINRDGWKRQSARAGGPPRGALAAALAALAGHLVALVSTGGLTNYPTAERGRS
jgi:hypothetical protein